MADTFDSFLTAVKARLDADTDFSASPAVTVLADDEGDFEKKFDRQLAALTIVAVVFVLDWVENNAERTGELTFAVNLLENGTKNRSSLRASARTARQLVQATRNQLRGWSPVIAGETDVWTAIESQRIHLVAKEPEINWQFTGKCFRALT